MRRLCILRKLTLCTSTTTHTMRLERGIHFSWWSGHLRLNLMISYYSNHPNCNCLRGPPVSKHACLIMDVFLYFWSTTQLQALNRPPIALTLLSPLPLSHFAPVMNNHQSATLWKNPHRAARQQEFYQPSAEQSSVTFTPLCYFLQGRYWA